MPNVVRLQAESDRLTFRIETLEQDILAIRRQLDEAAYAEDEKRQEGSDWWHRARDALRHKERDRAVLVARLERIQRRLRKVHPDIRKAQKKEALRGVLKALFVVARAALDYYERTSEEHEENLADALDQLDQAVPGWDGPQVRKTPFRKLDL